MEATIPTTLGEDLAKQLSQADQANALFAKMLNQARDDAIVDRERFHNQWPFYVRLYVGDHGRDKVQLRKNKAHIVSNQCAKAVNASVPFLTDARVRGQVSARQPGAEEVSRAYDVAWEYIQESNEIDRRIFAPCLIDSMTLGMGCAKYRWDKDRLQHVIDRVDPFNIFVDGLTKDPDSIRHFIERITIPLSEAKRRWPVYADRFKEIYSLDADERGGLYRPRLQLPQFGMGQTFFMKHAGQSGVDEYPVSGGRTGVERQKYVEVWEHWIRDTYSEDEFEGKLQEQQGVNAASDATHENHQLAMGEDPIPRVGDIHAGHLGTHREFFKNNVGNMGSTEIDRHLRHSATHQEMLASVEARKQKYPGGWRVVLVSNETVLEDGPSDIGAFPYAFLPNYILPGEFFGLSEFVHLASMQMGLNRVWSAIVDQVRWNAFRPLMKDSLQSKIKTESLEDGIGAIYDVVPNPQGKPLEWGPEFPLNGELLAIAHAMRAEMLESVGISEVMEGMAKAGDSGVKIKEEKESTLTRTRERARGVEYFVRQLSKAGLAGIHTHWDFPQTIKVKGIRGQNAPGAQPVPGDATSTYVPLNMTQPDGSMMNNLQGVGLEELDVHVDASGTLPNGRQKRLQDVLQLAQLQLPPGGVLPMQILLKKLAELNAITQDDLLEIMQIVNAPPPPPQTPPPNISVSLKGDLSPQVAMALAEGQPPPPIPAEPPPPPGGDGGPGPGPTPPGNIPGIPAAPQINQDVNPSGPGTPTGPVPLQDFQQ